MSDLLHRIDAAIEHDACPSLLTDVRAELKRLSAEHAGLCNSVDRLVEANDRLRGLLREVQVATNDKPEMWWCGLRQRIDAALGTASQPRPLTSDERAALDRAFERSITVIHPGIDATGDQPSDDSTLEPGEEWCMNVAGVMVRRDEWEPGAVKRRATDNGSAG